MASCHRLNLKVEPPSPSIPLILVYSAAARPESPIAALGAPSAADRCNRPSPASPLLGTTRRRPHGFSSFVLITAAHNTSSNLIRYFREITRWSCLKRIMSRFTLAAKLRRKNKLSLADARAFLKAGQPEEGEQKASVEVTWLCLLNSTPSSLKPKKGKLYFALFVFSFSIFSSVTSLSSTASPPPTLTVWWSGLKSLLGLSE